MSARGVLSLASADVLRIFAHDTGAFRLNKAGAASLAAACAEALEVCEARATEPQPQPVDVLAVMDDAEKCLARGVVRIQCAERAEEMREARAAVAELIAAVRESLAELDNVTAATDSESDSLGRAENLLRAALARIGGTPHAARESSELERIAARIMSRHDAGELNLGDDAWPLHNALARIGGAK